MIAKDADTLWQRSGDDSGVSKAFEFTRVHREQAARRREDAQLELPDAAHHQWPLRQLVCTVTFQSGDFFDEQDLIRVIPAK